MADLFALQANNMYIFPGLALGAHLGKTGTVTDMMIQTSAEALPELITAEDLRLGYVFPRLSDARYVRLELPTMTGACQRR